MTGERTTKTSREERESARPYTDTAAYQDEPRPRHRKSDPTCPVGDGRETRRRLKLDALERPRDLDPQRHLAMGDLGAAGEPALFDLTKPDRLRWSPLWHPDQRSALGGFSRTEKVAAEGLSAVVRETFPPPLPARSSRAGELELA